MSAAVYEEICAGLKRLKLSTVRKNLEDYLRMAESRSLSCLEFLNGLIKEELKGREESNYHRRLKAARFPVIKRLDDFDFSFQPSIPIARINNLRECRWVENADNLIFAGQTGVGKSHLSIGFGVEAIERGYTVYFTTLSDLMDEMNIAAASGKLAKLEKKLLKPDCLIIDELGYVKITMAQGNFLFRIISKCYENRSIIITTNKDFSRWADIFEDQVQVSALLDRLLHHAIIFPITGESYRVKGPHMGKQTGHDSDPVREQTKSAKRNKIK